MNFEYPPSIPLARIPTPVQKLERLTRAWGGPEIYVKRDDLTGCVLSGNKVRKLEFSLAEARERGAEVLITCGGVQSNHARATAAAAARLGWKTVLFLRGTADAPPEGNLFLDRLLGAEVRFITAEAYQQVGRLMAEAALGLEEEGKRAYIIPEGASNGIGYFGYLRAAEEIAGQLEAMRLAVDHVVTATGSGGTLGGLELGRRIHGLDFTPIGINVCDTAEHFRNRIRAVAAEMIDRYGWDLDAGKTAPELIDGYVGEGYALSRPEELAFIAEVARLEGIVLDPVYTGKALFGLRDQIRKGRFGAGQKILFLHTGGIFGLFPAREAYRDIIR